MASYGEHGPEGGVCTAFIFKFFPLCLPDLWMKNSKGYGQKIADIYLGCCVD